MQAGENHDPKKKIGPGTYPRPVHVVTEKGQETWGETAIDPITKAEEERAGRLRVEGWGVRELRKKGRMVRWGDCHGRGYIWLWIEPRI